MKRGHGFAGWLFLIVIAGTTGVLAEERIGMITDVRGTVEVESPDGTRPARMMSLLDEGDVLRVGEAATASLILFASGERFRLEARSSVEVQASRLGLRSGGEPVALPPLPRDATQILRDQMSDGDPGRGAGVVFRGGPAKEQLVLVEPVDTRIATLQPSFAWQSLQLAERYRLTVSDLEGIELWETVTTESRIRYPASAPALETGGLYFWDVRAYVREGGSIVAGAEFSVLEDEELVSLERQQAALGRLEGGGDSGPRIALVALLMDLELYQDADRLLSSLAEAHPEETSIRKVKRDLYSRWGRPLPARDD